MKIRFCGEMTTMIVFFTRFVLEQEFFWKETFMLYCNGVVVKDIVTGAGGFPELSNQTQCR